MSKLEATCTWDSYRKYLAVGGSWRVQKNERPKDFIVRQKICGRCSGKYTLCGHGFTDITWQFPISQDFWEIKRMCKQCMPGSLFPPPTENLGTRLQMTLLLSCFNGDKNLKFRYAISNYYSEAVSCSYNHPFYHTGWSDSTKSFQL